MESYKIILKIKNKEFYIAKKSFINTKKYNLYYRNMNSKNIKFP